MSVPALIRFPSASASQERAKSRRGKPICPWMMPFLFSRFCKTLKSPLPCVPSTDRYFGRALLWFRLRGCVNFILTGMASLPAPVPSAIVCMRLTKSALINGPDNLLLLVFPRRLLSILHSALEQVFSEKLFVWSRIFFEF